MTERIRHSAMEPPTVASRRRSIGYFLRHSANLHYFAAIKPYLDHFLGCDDCENHILVPHLQPDYEEIPDFAGYTHLFKTDRRIDDHDLVLTPTFLRPEDRQGPRNGGTRVVQVFHGMSDKPFTYERDFSDYALCLCAGQRQLDRLLSQDQNRNIRWAMVGYPKFDTIATKPPRLTSNRKTLVYAPTWRKGGISSIERFLDAGKVIATLTQRYNLIVKPHPNIFNPTRPYFDQSIVDRLDRLPDILLVRSGNVMPWLARANLFIGDISAAGYEWLYFNRPMVFLNPRPRELRASRDVEALTYLWQCGDVCDDVDRLPAAIEGELMADAYAVRREEVLHYSVHQSRDGQALARGIAAIEALFAEALMLDASNA